MPNFINRTLATSLTTFLFLVMGTTGVLMFFHIFDSYTKELHEILGLAFVFIVFIHVLFNWKSMRTYFSKTVFKLSFVLVVVVSLAFILTSSSGPNPKKLMINSLLSAPLEHSLAVLSNDRNEAIMKLENAGLKVKDAKNIKELGRVNRTSPFQIVDIITN